GDERDASLTRGLTRGFWVAVALVMAVAVATTWFLADRILRPVASLTAAARAMTGGDLTARVEASGADELGQLGAAFNEMAANIEAEDRARRTLTVDVAHELRSPLANLRGYLEAIQDGVITPDDDVISSLHQESVVLQHLVDDLQELSLAETGRLRLRRTPTDVGDLVERVVAAHQGAAAAAGVTLTAETEPGCSAPVDGDRIRQILGNLIGNAIRHTNYDGAVTVAVRDGDPLAVTVTDTGEGIAPEHLPQLFDRFYRADQSRARATGGTGLGLAIARELARAHQGDITVASRPGHGSTFTLTLPR
ncbi:MAG: ATP-binding protein, partial [Actinomycetota bacterium]